MYNPQITVTRIKEKGKSENVSVSKLNEQCGLNKNTISASATSKMGLSAKILFDIDDCLGCSVDYLLGRTDKPEGIETALSVSGNQQTNISGNNSINVSTEHARELDNEISTLLLRLSLRERVELMSMIYKYVDEHAEK